MLDRRSFVGGFISILAGGPVALSAGQMEDGSPLEGDAAILAWAIRTYGEDAIAEEIAALLREPDGFTVRRLKTRLNRISRRRGRAKQAAERRERHAGDEVLYRGPVHIPETAWGQLVHRQTRGLTVSGRRVDVGRTQTAWAIFGIRTPRPAGYHNVYREDELAGYAPDDGDCKAAIVPAASIPLPVPAGSRILLDTRNGRPRIMTAELIRTASGDHRLHLWAHSRPKEDAEVQTVPALALADSAHGAVYETPSEIKPWLVVESA
jgi:hypothetical protein